MDLQKILALCSLHCTMLCTSLSFLVQDAFKCLVTTSTARVKASQNKLYVILGLSALEVILIAGEDYRFYQEASYASFSPNYLERSLSEIFGLAIRNNHIHHVNAHCYCSAAFDKQQCYNLFIAFYETHLARTVSRFDEWVSAAELNFDIERMVHATLTYQGNIISYAADFMEMPKTIAGSHVASGEVLLQDASFKNDSKSNYLKILYQMLPISFEFAHLSDPMKSMEQLGSVKFKMSNCTLIKQLSFKEYAFGQVG